MSRFLRFKELWLSTYARIGRFLKQHLHDLGYMVLNRHTDDLVGLNRELLLNTSMIVIVNILKLSNTAKFRQKIDMMKCDILSHYLKVCVIGVQSIA